MNCFERKKVNVLGSNIHYLEGGEGAKTFVFLHGMPTSSFLWRNVINKMSAHGRCIAPDLIGMGDSDRPNIHYGIHNHIQYVDSFIHSLNLDDFIFVLHGWGSIIGFDYARRFPAKVAGLAFYESHVRPVPWEDASLMVKQFASFYHKEDYDSIVVQNDLVEKFIPQAFLGEVPKETMDVYRNVYNTPYDRRVLQDYLKEAPLGKGSSVSYQVIEDYVDFLCESECPKLLMYANPGFLTTIETVIWARDHLKNLTIKDLGEGLHFVQESNPSAFNDAVEAWLESSCDSVD